MGFNGVIIVLGAILCIISVIGYVIYDHRKNKKG
jgi:hypothetical protein